MADTTYRGAWGKATRTNLVTPLHQPLDEAHSNPDVEVPDIEVDTTGAPTLPMDLIDGQYLQPPVTGGPLDMTPMDHSVGVGAQPGVSLDVAREIGVLAHEVDMGSVESRLEDVPQTGTRLGEYHVEDVRTLPNNGDSPDFPEIRYDSGVGVASDPFARSSWRIQRWTDGEIDWHRWATEYRPRFLRNSNGSMAYAPPAVGAPWLSPFGSGEIVYQDDYQPSQERRAPRGWDEQDTVDVVGVPMAADFGLPTWGL